MVRAEQRRVGATVGLVSMFVLGACLEAAAVVDVDVEKAEVVARKAGEEVAAGLDNAREKVEAVGGDLRNAADEAARQVSDPRNVDPGAAASLSSEAATAVVCTDDDRCTMTADYADRLRANPGFLAGQARVVPHHTDGQADGLEISGLESLAKAMGFRERDVVHSVNGLRVQSLQSAPQLYLQLRSARRFTVVFTRGSERHTRVIEIQ